MSTIKRIAREEWRALFRNNVAVFGLVLLTLLTLMAAFNAWEHQRNANAERAYYQAQANQEFEAQPDRHPHRVVHYGHFLFRPLNTLAAFDPGIDAYTGHTLFLEGHRQNSANFGDVRQSSLMLRFGQLSPAFVLQVLAPLLLIFVGYASVARERESGTLRVLLAQGVRSRQVILGKLLALCGFAGLIISPAVLSLVVLMLTGQAAWGAGVVLLVGYSIWLLLWSLGIVLLSGLFSRERDALLSLLTAWVVLVVLIPRWVPDSVNATISFPTRFESQINVEREYKALGDAHNPDDPLFSQFRNNVLAKYGVERIEDLPVNYKGLVGMESERLSSELFNRYASDNYDLQQKQLSWVDHFGVISPILALRRISMATAGTDLAAFRRFMEQGEQYRYDLVQGLNQLQVDELSYADDTTPNKENRVSSQHWQQFPPFAYQPTALSATLQSVAFSVAVLFLWLLMLALAVWFLGDRLGRVFK